MAKNNLKNWAYGVGITAAVVGLFAWPIITDPHKAEVAQWKAAGLGCLGGHMNAHQHIHQQLLITVDGAPETLSGDIGIVPSCMAEVHVHRGESNLLHVESVLPDKKLTLGQFFVVYGKPIQRDGYKLEIKVNGTVYAQDPASLVLQDKQVIEMKYTKI